MSSNVFRVLSTLTSLRCLSALPTINRAFNSAILTKYPISALNYKLQIRENSVKAGSNDVIDLTKFVTYEEIKELPSYPAKMLIDVREPKELEETGRIPTSINIPLKQVPEKLSQDFSTDNFKSLFQREKPTFDTEIIFYCKIGARSQAATDLCYKLGYKKSFLPFLVKIVSETLELSAHEFVNKFRRLKPTPYTEIIFSCRSGKRAEDACEMARNLGFKNVKNYKGSWMEWAEKEGLKK